jgi:hypothetical protein
MVRGTLDIFFRGLGGLAVKMAFKNGVDAGILE